MEKNRFLDTMIYRHASKEFDDTKKISDEDFDDILQMGRLSPSSFGLEPWKFLVVQNQNLRDKIKEFSWGAKGQLPTASHFVIILARKRHQMIYDSPYIDKMFRQKQLPQDIVDMYRQFYKDFQISDFDLLQSDRAIFDWACKQTYIALANMMTGAAYMGIDSCAIEGYDAASADRFAKDELGVDMDKFGISVMVAFGYRKNAPRDKNRQPLEDISSWYK